MAAAACRSSIFLQIRRKQNEYKRDIEAACFTGKKLYAFRTADSALYLDSVAVTPCDPADVVKQVCGAFDPSAYVEYLTNKYTKLYEL